MKDLVKYIISTIIFFVVYVSMIWLFTKSIDWKMTIIATVIYGVTYALSHIFLVKKID